MGESLLGSSNVILFGYKIDDIALVKDKVYDPDTFPTWQNANAFVAKQLTTAAGTTAKPLEPCFARIYAFVYGGKFYELDLPTVFLVHGEGKGVKDDAGIPVGMVAQDFTIADDVKTWAYADSDFLVRLDVSSGPLDELLLAPEGDIGIGMAGAKVSGAKVSGAKVSGAKVSGAKVSGAKVSGAKVSGAKVSGAKLQGD
ncbi:MAG: pentapeptide repeat-containing protein [Pseudomonadota bacterium]